MTSYQELYRRGVEQLEAASVGEADLDARLLLEEICGTDRNYLLSHGENPVTKEQHDAYLSSIEKRRRHIPLQHILG